MQMQKRERLQAEKQSEALLAKHFKLLADKDINHKKLIDELSLSHSKELSNLQSSLVVSNDLLLKK